MFIESLNCVCYRNLILSISIFSELATKGVKSLRELHKTKITQPRDQISALPSYSLPSSTSGA